MKRVGALVAGLLAGIILSVGTDSIMHAIGYFPALGEPMDTPRYAVATGYRIIYNVLACWIAARLAPDRPMLHAMILGIIGFVLSTAGLLFMKNVGPMWYPLSLVITAFPTAWLGGKLAIVAPAPRP